MEFAVAAWAVEGEPSPSYVGSAKRFGFEVSMVFAKHSLGKRRGADFKQLGIVVKLFIKLHLGLLLLLDCFHLVALVFISMKPGRLWPEAESLIPPSSDALANSSCNTEIDFKLNNPSL
ncbi:hypothetical protein HPP92_003824 [Vanilla planifolia]|uniref:Uncharacterized protein n=1 Tax=Vanilla planifolia TaxID=51239 RepID=A0A835VLV4_VANPL|nr:hypothetical protein HPP92_003824 [Vanilla planifolia]